MLKREIVTGGFIIINKPIGPTTHDIIDRLRKITGIKRIGHAGTLDPFASGVLVVAIGRAATRELKRYVGLDKEYRAILRLGAVTDTYDRTGKVEVRSTLSFAKAMAGKKYEVKKVGTAKIKEVLAGFIGKQEQVPPMFSAKKVNGKKLYKLARQGIEIEREPVSINVYRLELLSYRWPRLDIKVRCSSGTYVRALAHDIGAHLGCGAYLEELERTAVGEYRIDAAVGIARITESSWKSHLFKIHQAVDH